MPPDAPGSTPTPPAAAGPLTSPPRRSTRPVRIGPLTIGGGHPVLIQSMTVSDTMATDAVVEEIRELVAAGCPLVRLTAPSQKEAENLREIRHRLETLGIRVPLVADIHFTPNAALTAAEIVEKVRINPGNYADKKRFAVREYTDDEYRDELERVAERFRPLIERLRAHGAALRIGVNHGSLSDRILNRFGDTPAGMVESALEFARICEEMGYRELVFSMKSSVPSVMLAAYRLLAERLDALGMDYPLHLGVTEAGNGLEGRIKSAIGIGALLCEGIGDTIRVSLTEDSRHEISAARAILEAVDREGVSPAEVPPPRASQPWTLGRLGFGSSFPVRVEARHLLPVDAENSAPFDPGALGAGDQRAELLSVRPLVTGATRPSEIVAALDRLHQELPPRDELPVLIEWSFLRQGEIHLIEMLLPYADGLSLTLGGEHDLRDADRFGLLSRLMLRSRRPVRWRIPATVARPGAMARRISELCRAEGLNDLGFLCAPGPLWLARTRELAAALAETGDLHFLEVPRQGPSAALLAGAALLDGVGDCLCLATDADAPAWPAGGVEITEAPVPTAFAILQACRLRLTRAEFIACPSCGRTQFDLQTVTRQIRARTEHLKGVKIAIMGCIVNGPGEMADADFGYVGSGAGKVDLYVGKERVQAGLTQDDAPDRLVELIRAHGRWIEPPAK